MGARETMHFQVWHDKAGNAPQITDTTQNLSFPDLNGGIDPNTGKNTVDGGPAADLFQTNLIMPEPTIFLNSRFGPVAIIRATTKPAGGGAVLARQRHVDACGV